MPTLTKASLLQALAKALASDPTLTAEKLNTPQEVGSKVGTLTAAEAIPVLTPQALRALLDLAVSDAPATDSPARDAAIAWQENLAQGEIALTEGSQGRKAIDALVTGKVLTEAERTTLIGLATEKTYGATLGETLGIGRIYPENLDQARTYAAKQQEVPK